MSNKKGKSYYVQKIWGDREQDLQFPRNVIEQYGVPENEKNKFYIARPVNHPKSRMVKAFYCPIISENFYNVNNQFLDPKYMNQKPCQGGYKPVISNDYAPAVPQVCNTMNIGKGDHNDLNLDDYGSCKYVMPKQAVVFYDTYEKQYEIINYSMYGSKIYNCNYGFGGGHSGDGEEAVAGSSESTEKAAIQETRKLVGFVNTAECRCVEGDNKTDDCEDSCIIKHGALLKFGCISFIFNRIKYPLKV